MPQSNTNLSTAPIELGANERINIRNSVVALPGQPGVNITGDNARLNLSRSGSISALDDGNTGVLSSGDSVFINNRGAIAGHFNGISSTGNSLNLRNAGVISSNSRAVDISDGDNLSVSNRGTILGTGNQRNGTFYVDGTVDNLALTNAQRAVIDTGEGNLGDAVSVQVGTAGDLSNDNININNRGLLQGRGDGPEVFAEGARVAANGSSGLRFFNGSEQPQANISGSIRNSGTITAEVNVGFLGGLVVEDGVAFSGEIDNVRGGVISGPRNGLYIGEAEHNLTINNRGRIESGSRVVNIDGSGVRFSNSGEVIGTGNQRNGTVYADSTAETFSIRNERRGIIDAGEGNEGAGISLQLGDEAGDVVESVIFNSGLVQGRGAGADGTNAAGDGVRLFTTIEAGVVFQGDINNQQGGRIIGSLDGVTIQENVTLQGDINNGRRSQIVGGEDGIHIEGTLNGAINNDGIIQGNLDSINAQAATAGVTINNAGLLEGNVSLSEFNDVFNSSRRGLTNGVIAGLGGDDVLSGDRADNLLDGGTDNDTLRGGAGRDTFIFSTADFGTDTIQDFINGQDLLDVSFLNLGAGEIQEAISQAQQLGNDTQLTFAQGSVLLHSVKASELDSSDFVLD